MARDDACQLYAMTLERMGGSQPRGQGPPFGAADAQGIADPRITRRFSPAKGIKCHIHDAGFYPCLVKRGSRRALHLFDIS